MQRLLLRVRGLLAAVLLGVKRGLRFWQRLVALGLALVPQTIGHPLFGGAWLSDWQRMSRCSAATAFLARELV